MIQDQILDAIGPVLMMALSDRTVSDRDAFARQLTPDQRAALNALTGQSYGGSEAWDGDHPFAIHVRDRELWDDGEDPCGATSGWHDDGDPMNCTRPESHDGDHHCGPHGITWEPGTRPGADD